MLTPSPTATRQSFRSTRRMVEATLPLLAVGVGLPLLGLAYLINAGSATAAEPLTTAQAFLLRSLEVVPSALMAFAMWGLRKILMEYERNLFLSTATITKFRQVGYFALAAILLKVVVVPGTRAATLGDWRPLLDLESFDFSLLIFGVLLAIVGAAFTTAAAGVKAENDEIV